jgi:hypothetical protein
MPEKSRLPSVSPGQLADWRRRLVQLLARLETPSSNQAQQSVAVRISHLSRDGRIPREIAAVMRTVTEMRNAAEYDSKTLTPTESALLEAAWKTLQEWAENLNLTI